MQDTPAITVTTKSTSDLSASLFNSITIGLLEVFWWIAMLAFIFTGPLSIYLGRAAIFVIAGAVVSGGVLSYFCSWRGTIGMPQDVPAAILVVVTGALVRDISAEVSLDVQFVTIVATIGLASVITGIFFLIFGYLNLGNLVRLLPFPVMAGFLGGTGWLILLGGISSAVAPGEETNIFQPSAVAHWMPAIGLALLIYAIGRRIKHPLLVPGMMVIAIIAFYAITLPLGYSIEQLTDGGWLIGALPAGNQLKIFTIDELRTIQWSAIFAQSGSLLVLAFASIIAMLLNNSGFELNIRTDLDPNRDMRVHGIANILGGLIGGWPTYMTPAWSSINAKGGRRLALSGLISPIFAGILLWYATQYLAILPRFVTGATVAYIGVLFFVDWVIEPAKRLERLEYAMLLGILLVIASFGLLEGVGVGLIMAVILFVVSYGRINVVRHRITGKHQRSRVTRSAEQRDYLRSVGEQIQILQLQGYVFFGTANGLLQQVREAIETDHINFLILDFARVSGVDSTALLNMAKMQQLVDGRDMSFLLTGLSEKSKKQITHELVISPTNNLFVFDRLDEALQWSEERLLLAADYDPNSPMPPLEQQLRTLLPEAENIGELLSLMDLVELSAGHYLMRQGDAPDNMYFIREGAVTAQLEREDGTIRRLETMGSGRVVGELGFYLDQPRTAAVVSNGDTWVYRLTRDRLNEIERDHPDAASTLHQLIVHLLSDRVTHLVGVVDVLLK